ncbi:hypothetical protein [Microscilla marina]|uniref:Uncharacterized protein n=1 Tax=Microscilla marina ATCC 23134 TaxID=313606 RepID=A1ZUV7_MICM2|nr:hypothetical protein [Microscilla marina]EAY25861.1 hypothetical protein M23134_07673 [Microscilla marina ATCC 23134]
MKTKNIDRFTKLALSPQQQSKCVGGNAKASPANNKAMKPASNNATSTEYIILLVVIA